MAQSLKSFMRQYSRGITLLILAIAVVLPTHRNPHINTAPPAYNSSTSKGNILNPSTAIDVTDGRLSGDVYKSNDPSAFNKIKITFGNSNSVSFSNPSKIPPTTIISTGNFSKSSAISRLDYGADEIWYDGGYGAQNLSTNQLFSNVVKLTNNIGVSVIRYPGGIPSDTFNWQNAIGPQSKRTSNVIYQAQDVFLPSNFGPDEFGQMLSKTNSVGDITVNFGTGTAQEAANWVQYMTASSQTNPWGELRAKNGHPAPYNIPYWEVGNEQQSSSGENYWRSGSVVTIGDKNDHCPSNDNHLCEYVYGGTTSFAKQKTIGANNNPLGNGTPNQIFYALYPPIAASSQTIYVNGEVWRSVPELTQAGPGQKVYQLDNSTGKITFGNGTNGEVLPTNASVTISYHSGPHDGFIDYYKLMKSADPKAQICSSYDYVGFIQLMGSTNPYDCLVAHLYGGGIPSTNDSAILFHNSLMEQSNQFANAISSDQAEIKQYAGSRANDISMAITEYGTNALTSPSGLPNYHRSQDAALFVANTLRAIVEAHVPIAEKHYLISYQNSPAPGLQTYINSNTFANNALIAGPGPNPFIQPSGLVLEAYSKLLYSNLVSSNVQNNPNIIYSGGSYSALSTLATTDGKGHESIMVINLSASSTIKAEIMPSLSNYKKLSSWTLGANSFLAYNTVSDPLAVGLVNQSHDLQNGRIVTSFAPGSITIMQLQ